MTTPLLSTPDALLSVSQPEQAEHNRLANFPNNDRPIFQNQVSSLGLKSESVHWHSSNHDGQLPASQNQGPISQGGRIPMFQDQNTLPGDRPLPAFHNQGQLDYPPQGGQLPLFQPQHASSECRPLPSFQNLRSLDCPPPLPVFQSQGAPSEALPGFQNGRSCPSQGGGLPTLQSSSQDRQSPMFQDDDSSSEDDELPVFQDQHSSSEEQLPEFQNQQPSVQNEQSNLFKSQDSSTQDEQSTLFKGQSSSSKDKQSTSLQSRESSSHDGEFPALREEGPTKQVLQSSAVQGTPTKAGQLSLFKGSTPQDIRSSLQEELAALRCFKIPSKRTELTLQEKVDLLNHSQGKSQRQLAQMFSIGKSQVQTILKRKQEILKAYEQNCVSDRKRFGKRAENDDVNKFTWEWFQEMSKTQGIQVNGPMLQEQAKQYAKQLGRVDFKASNGWLASFRKRHNILSSEQGLSTQEPTKISSWKDNLKKTMNKYNYKDILCLTELHLNYASMPDKIKAMFGKKKGDNPDNCLTVMLWYNMLGDFDTPVVIGRHPWQPQYGVEETDMPVIWRWNSNAWVSSDIFQEWVRALDRKFQQQGRHVLLFLEHTSVHFLDLHLEHVEFRFHPSNSLEATPFNNDVIQRFRFCYQKQLMQYVISQMGSHQESVVAIASCVSILESCLWINQAVGQIFPSVVKKSFSKSLPDHINLSELEESDDNSGSESTESEQQSGYSVEEELEFQTLIGIILTSLNAANPATASSLDSSQTSDEQLSGENDAKVDGVSSSPGDSKARRVELTLQEKVELLRIHHHNGKSQRQLAQMFGIGKSQAHSILKRKNEILDHYENNANLARKRICRRAENDDVNRLTLEWYTEVSKLADIPITGPMVQEKAKRIAAELGRTDFKASNGWLDSFRKRNNIAFFFSRGPNSTVSDENLEDITVSFPSSQYYHSSVGHPETNSEQYSQTTDAEHEDAADSDAHNTVKKEPLDASEQSGASEAGAESPTDSHNVDTNSHSGNTTRVSEPQQTPSTSMSSSSEQPKQDKTDLIERNNLSILEKSSIETFHKAAVMARELRMFCEDKNLAQLSVMLEFVEKQLQIKHIGVL